MIITSEIYEAQGGLKGEVLDFYCHKCGDKEKGSAYDYLCITCENLIMKRDDEFSESYQLQTNIL